MIKFNPVPLFEPPVEKNFEPPPPLPTPPPPKNKNTPPPPPPRLSTPHLKKNVDPPPRFGQFEHCTYIGTLIYKRPQVEIFSRGQLPKEQGKKSTGRPG